MLSINPNPLTGRISSGQAKILFGALSFALVGAWVVLAHLLAGLDWEASIVGVPMAAFVAYLILRAKMARWETQAPVPLRRPTYSGSTTTQYGVTSFVMGAVLGATSFLLTGDPRATFQVMGLGAMVIGLLLTAGIQVSSDYAEEAA